MLTAVSTVSQQHAAEITVQMLRPSVDLAQYSQVVWSFLSRADDEFVPPLSERTEDPAKFNHWSRLGSPVAFYDVVMGHHMLLATVDGEPAGMLSFHIREHNSSLMEFSPCTYVIMTYVDPRFRRMGIATRLNEFVETLPRSMASPWIARRIWSTNYVNIALLQKRGFTEAVRIRNHRGPGVDTIYAVRRTNAELRN
jgi:ribosomal protein S18 acetylase RimI-like enzyme